MSIRQFIPNLFTLGNLLSGVFGIVATTMYGMPEVGGLCILIGAFLDLFDGAAARALNASSPVGAQLDSLADMVTFGVLPGMIAFVLIPVQVHGHVLDAWLPDMDLLRYVAFLIPVASAWRLAVFNVDETQTTGFKGMPTPANGLLWASIPLMLFVSTANNVFCVRASFSAQHAEFTLRDVAGEVTAPSTLSSLREGLNLKFTCEVDPWWDLFSHGSFTLLLVVLSSALMVSRIPLMSFKMKRGTRRPLWIWLGLSAGVIATFTIGYLNPFAAIPIVLLLYLLISIITNVTTSRHAVQSRD